MNAIHEQQPIPAGAAAFSAEGASVGRRIVWHIITIFCVAGLLAVLPLAIYCAWVFAFAKSAADLGGPLNFAIIPVMGGIGGVAGGLIVFMPLSLVAQRTGFRRWVKWSGILTLVLVLIIAGSWVYDRAYTMEPRTIPIVLVASMLLYWVGGFFAYLWCLVGCRKVLS